MLATPGLEAQSGRERLRDFSLPSWIVPELGLNFHKPLCFTGLVTSGNSGPVSLRVNTVTNKTTTI